LFTDFFVFYFLAEQQTCYHDSGVSVTPPPPRDVTITTRVMQRTNKKRKELVKLLVINNKVNLKLKN
jgi:hypothetical protein